MRISLASLALLCLGLTTAPSAAEDDAAGAEFFERHVRPVLVKHCYECHSEQAGERQGGLLLDRRSGWLVGGDTQKAVVPGNPDASLLIQAIRYADEDLQMPPDGALPPELVRTLERWVRIGAPGPRKDLDDTEFSRLGDQAYLLKQAGSHWAFEPPRAVEPPAAADPQWSRSPIDQFVFARMTEHQLTPSPPADLRILVRRLTYDLTGLPPSMDELTAAVAELSTDDPRDHDAAYERLVDRLLDSPEFGEHLGRMWLDVARYADTDSFYRPDTRTPHYFPFAFTYRDYVIQSLNEDKPFDQFVREQLAADLLGLADDAPELAALGFLTVGPHANRNPTEALDDWIDVTTRGLLGLTAACARCHDHKYEPIPTTDYYALRGVFNAVVRVKPLDEDRLPELPNYPVDPAQREDYLAKRAAIDAKLEASSGKKSKGNNRSVVQKIRETELAELLLFHPGAPARAMVVLERPRAPASYVLLRGDPARQGEETPRRFLTVLDPQLQPFPDKGSGRLELAERIVAKDNPLTARVFVNRVWGHLIGAYLVDTPSDFGLQGAAPSHPQLLDWLARDFVEGGWSVKRLVRTIVRSQTYRQASARREAMAAIDPQNQWLWRAHRKHLGIEAIRDSMLAISGQLDRTPRGRPEPLWGADYSRRRSIYGYVNRFNLDPTLRVFGFPTPMQTQPRRRESIVAPQSLFTMNAPFVIDQAVAVTDRERFRSCETDSQRAEALLELVLQRKPQPAEVARILAFVEQQRPLLAADRAAAESSKPKPTKSGKPQRGRPSRKIESPWPLAAQALMMSNEFQYVD